ncbi:MAG: hypothetical protein ABIR92_01965 [Gemmatimonadaceae bacterium]
MGAGAGAAVAIAAAKQRRLQEVVDAFRVGDATSPDRARPLESLGVAHLEDADELMVDGVLLPGPQSGTYFLSEAGYIVRRDRRMTLKNAIVIALSITLLFGILATYWVTRTQ